ncbi:hypothetical protein [Streptomyces sp. 8N706]|uniref:hypothetical protein n=1 Tax=Streptomyces sp. 8N706 TaxID=3457416 RepID=UPI003FD49DD9
MQIPKPITDQTDMDRYARQIASQLGRNGRTEALPGHGAPAARIVDDEGRALEVVRDYSRSDQLTIYARLPEDAPASAPSIGVSALSPGHVAGHIRRRLYPAHTEALDHARAIQARRTAERQACTAVAERLAGLIPGAQILHDHPCPRQTTLSCTLAPSGAPWNAGRISAEVGPDGTSVRLEVNAGPDEAEHALRGLSVLLTQQVPQAQSPR